MVTLPRVAASWAPGHGTYHAVTSPVLPMVQVLSGAVDVMGCTIDTTAYGVEGGADVIGSCVRRIRSTGAPRGPPHVFITAEYDRLGTGAKRSQPVDASTIDKHIAKVLDGMGFSYESTPQG